MEHQNVVRASIVTAVALPSDRVTALAAGLTRATGRNVLVETQVDPAIIGGAVARIGGTVTTAASPGNSSVFAKRSAARPTRGAGASLTSGSGAS